ncbi:hypothetical protein [Limisalsivibrio acetivorans]|uniref:hypothetical protein n=1 Tax=Limisalsivibrio acetivorans TaxID=1304888 RepID=UPI0003B68ABF|nr:hypothetical protein [Limisalsivibrio acetivorans]
MFYEVHWEFNYSLSKPKLNGFQIIDCANPEDAAKECSDFVEDMLGLEPESVRINDIYSPSEVN